MASLSLSEKASHNHSYANFISPITLYVCAYATREEGKDYQTPANDCLELGVINVTVEGFCMVLSR
jgi:hypothetical protein